MERSHEARILHVVRSVREQQVGRPVAKKTICSCEEPEWQRHGMKESKRVHTMKRPQSNGFFCFSATCNSSLMCAQSSPGSVGLLFWSLPMKVDQGPIQDTLHMHAHTQHTTHSTHHTHTTHIHAHTHTTHAHTLHSPHIFHIHAHSLRL